MKNSVNRWLCVLLLLGGGALQAQAPSTITEVIFEEIEPGIEPYYSRLLLNERFLRLDDGRDQGDFVLFNLDTHEIHSFNHEERSHLMMRPLEPKPLDFELDFKVVKSELADAPRVNNLSPLQQLFFADAQLCKRSINVAGFLPQLTRALIDYEQAIVAQNIQTFDQVPASVRSACYVANNYLQASAYLEVGFPLFVIDDQQRQKKLISFRRIEKSDALFEQPADYSLYFPNAFNLPD